MHWNAWKYIILAAALEGVSNPEVLLYCHGNISHLADVHRQSMHCVDQGGHGEEPKLYWIGSSNQLLMVLL
jgi:hypothetical protein